MIARMLTYCSFVFINLGFAQNSDFYSANGLYEKGKFKEAIEAYGKIINQGHQSSELYYNMGNAYYQEADVGKAIWSFEKALKIDPANEDARFNLDFVSMQTIDQIDNERPGLGSWFRGVFYGPGINFWAKLSIAFSFIFSMMLFVFFKTKTRAWKNTSLLLGTVSGLGLILSLFVSHYHAAYLSEHSEGIIIPVEVEIKLSPMNEASSSFELHAGSKVSIVGHNNNWVEIEVNGNSGWMLQEEIWEI
jgi:tetratricopeptide (TPR) repeat protein